MHKDEKEEEMYCSAVNHFDGVLMPVHLAAYFTLFVDIVYLASLFQAYLRYKSYKEFGITKIYSVKCFIF